MTRILSIFATLLLFSSPVIAQEIVQEEIEKPSEKSPQQEEIKAQDDGNYETRLELSKKMHDIWPIRQKVESALDSIGQRLPQQERLKFKSALRKAIDFEALEKTSTDAMADIFTEKELEKMIDFYGSKEGRSVSHKTSDYEKALQPLMTKMMDKALIDIKMGSQSTPKK